MPKVLFSTPCFTFVKKCRYYSADALGPVATPAQMGILLSAFQEGRVKVLGKAHNCLTGLWYISTDEFVKAIRCHLESGYRVFRKFERGTSVLLPNKVEASVWIREPDDEDDYDDGTVYVELTLCENEVILVFNSHEHEEGRPRLPR